MRALVFLCYIHIQLMFELYFELGLFGMFQIRDQERENDASSWLEYLSGLGEVYSSQKQINIITKSAGRDLLYFNI